MISIVQTLLKSLVGKDDAGRQTGVPFFIIGCSRSGTTALTQILDTASNGECVVEPMSNLSRESRLLMDGRLADPVAKLKEIVIPRVEEGLGRSGLYGEKNVTYGPFIPYLYDLLKCRFVFVKRDGRDVVTSLINWHEQKFGNIYRECGETGNLSPEAVSYVADLPASIDDADFARPRPLEGDPLFAEWGTLTRLEMCAYYWARINTQFLDELERLPAGAWTEIDFTRPLPCHLMDVAAFCGLEGLDAGTAASMLERRINSLPDRGSAPGTFPNWENWDDSVRRKFERIADETMRRLGYFDDSGANWNPAEPDPH